MLRNTYARVGRHLLNNPVARQFSTTVDHYAVLGLPKNASFKDIQAKHRQLALQHHPDVGGKPEAFRSIQEAYEALDVLHNNKTVPNVSRNPRHPQGENFVDDISLSDRLMLLAVYVITVGTPLYLARSLYKRIRGNENTVTDATNETVNDSSSVRRLK